MTHRRPQQPRHFIEINPAEMQKCVSFSSKAAMIMTNSAGTVSASRIK
jgi:hypothetical protein